MVWHPHMPMATKMAVCTQQEWLCKCGCGGHLLFGLTVFDHRPPLMHRQFDPVLKLYTPDANDIRFIDGVREKCHAVRTFGPGGEKRITTRGGDIGEAAHEDAMGDKHSTHLAYMANKQPGQKRPLKNTFGRRAPRPP